MARRGDLNGWWWLGIALVGSATRILFRVRVRGIEHVPASGPAIVAANHVSALDGLVLCFVVGIRHGRTTRFLVAAEFFRTRVFGRVLRIYRQIPLRRGESDLDALAESAETIRSGALAGIFPEGTVNPEPEHGMQRGRRGLARIALTSGAPVVPVGIWGTHVRWPKAGLRYRRPWRPMLAISFGEPIEPAGSPDSGEDIQRLTDTVMERIAEQVEVARRRA